MPVIDLLIQDASTNILDSITYQTVDSVLETLGFQNYFPDNLNITSDYLGGSKTSDQNQNVNMSRDRCDVVVTHSVNPGDVKWDIMSFQHTQAYGTFNLNRYNLRPIFFDAAANVQVIEHFMPCSIALDFSMKFKNKEHAYLLISAIENTSLNASVIKYHDIAYEYPIGMNMYKVLWQIFSLRKSINTQIDFPTYLSKATNGAFSYLISKDVTTKQIVIKKSGVKALGVLEFSQSKPDALNSQKWPDRFVVNFTYTIQFSRPDCLRVTFPPVIENQLVPAFMVKTFPTTNQNDLIGLFQEKNMYAALRELSGKTPPLTKFPNYDDWAIPRSSVQQSQYDPFFIAGILLDTTTTNGVTTVNPTTVINLTELGDVAIDPTAIAIMKLHGNAIFQTQGLFNVSIFVNDIQIDPQYLTMDNDLNITLTWADPIKRYHMIIYEAKDISNLDPMWIDVILANRTYFPITVIKNLDFLIRKKIFYVDNTNELLLLIQQSIKNGNINVQIAALVTAGHVTDYLYLYATTEYQFASYLMDHRSPISDKLLYDEYVAVCVTGGFITTAALSSGYVRTRNGYPILANTGGSRGFNTPLRIWNLNVNAKKDRRTSCL